MTRPQAPAFERELAAFAKRAKDCPAQAVHFQHGRAHEAVLALGFAERALQAGAATARSNARTELERLEAMLDAWEHPENVKDAGAPEAWRPASSRRRGPKKTTIPRKASRAPARRGA